MSISDPRKRVVLLYFEALDADNWERVGSILDTAQKDRQLEDAILEAHTGLDYSDDVPLVQQVAKRYEGEKV